MMDQLGIKALRPGPSGDEKAPNHANYDESKANPYPNLPDPLTLNDGTKVTTAEDVVEASGGRRSWRCTRRVCLRPRAGERAEGDVDGDGGRSRDDRVHDPVIAKDLVGEVDNSSYPAIKVKIHMTLVTPAHGEGTGSGADDVWAGWVSGAE